VETAVLIPIKSFRNAKRRLAAAFGSDDRATLARAMSEIVLRAAAPFPAFVACDDDEVAEWVTERGAEVLWTPGLGLNGAIEHGVDVIAGKGADHVVISHGDLPLARSFAHLCEHDTVTLVPDHRLDGTNVQTRPAARFAPQYGAGSFRAHLASALADGRRVRVVVDAELAVDVDTIDELRDPRTRAVLDHVVPTLMSPDR
jgi:2-phospho-L-lactate/phosphoenolpyruvate guanylyltransferase